MDDLQSLELKYFVLRPYRAAGDDLHAQASRAALETYAAFINDFGRHAMAEEIKTWVDNSAEKALYDDIRIAQKAEEE